MNKVFRRLGYILGVLGLAGASAAAQDRGFDAAFKLRTGYGLSTNDDRLERRTLGFGFELGYQTTYGRWGAELGYQYKPGNQFLNDPSAMATAHNVMVDPTQSVDSRKNQLGGIAGRFSFERRLGASDFHWRLGFQVGGAKFRQEYIGDVSNGSTYEDTYNGIATKTVASFSPMAGLRWDLDAEEGLELNVISLGYTSANYVHVAGSELDLNGGHAGLDYIQTRARTLPHVELTYVLRF